MASEQLRVLVVDDDRELLALAEHGLSKAGMAVVCADDGHKALEKLERQAFDAAVVDIIMPEKEGLETIIEVRRRWPQLKVVAISGGGRKGSSAFLSTAKAFGAHATLAKPFEMSQLVEAIRQLTVDAGGATQA